MPPLTSSSYNKKYHLVWTPGFLPRVTCTLALIYTLSLIEDVRDIFDGYFEALKVEAVRGASHMKWWTLISLLSSSCCALQLFLNVFSVGCAGFNTVLGPYRPNMIGFGVAGQIHMWKNVRLNVQYSQAYAATLFTFFLTFLPEWVHLINMYNEWEVKRKKTDSVYSANCKIILEIQNMACVACVNTISNTIRGADGVLASSVDFKSGRANVVVANDTAAKMREKIDAICERVESCGFPCSQAKS